MVSQAGSHAKRGNNKFLGYVFCKGRKIGWPEGPRPAGLPDLATCELFLWLDGDVARCFSQDQPENNFGDWFGSRQPGSAQEDQPALSCFARPVAYVQIRKNNS